MRQSQEYDSEMKEIHITEIRAPFRGDGSKLGKFENLGLDRHILEETGRIGYTVSSS